MKKIYNQPILFVVNVKQDIVTTSGPFEVKEEEISNYNWVE